MTVAAPHVGHSGGASGNHTYLCKRVYRQYYADANKIFYGNLIVHYHVPWQSSINAPVDYRGGIMLYQDRWKIVEELGEGGQGKVFKAYLTTANTSCTQEPFEIKPC
jgi:hypothetical protein